LNLRKIRLAAACAVLYPGAALAQPDGPPDPHATLSLVIENDKFTGRDRHYTNGLQLSWMSSEIVPGWVAQLGAAMPMFADGARLRYGAALGHTIFTPDDTETSALVSNDRPYAGWLYANFSLAADAGDRLDRLTLSLGVIGPSAGGESVQNDWHSVIGVDDSNGWDNQLRDEPAFVLFYERQWRWLVERGRGGFGVDALPHVGGALGNVYTYASAGVTLRFGQDLPADYGPPRILPALPGSAFFRPRAGFGWYIFAGAEGRAVARDIFLDGNTFKDSHSVDKEPFVADLQAGIAFTIDVVRLAYTLVYRTREFEGQTQPDTFGSISLSLRW
jgi:hypothetical protein